MIKFTTFDDPRLFPPHTKIHMLTDLTLHFFHEKIINKFGEKEEEMKVTMSMHGPGTVQVREMLKLYV